MAVAVALADGDVSERVKIFHAGCVVSFVVCPRPSGHALAFDDWGPWCAAGGADFGWCGGEAAADEFGGEGSEV